jgi:hypothetical protein
MNDITELNETDLSTVAGGAWGDPCEYLEPLQPMIDRTPSSYV